MVEGKSRFLEVACPLAPRQGDATHVYACTCARNTQLTIQQYAWLYCGLTHCVYQLLFTPVKKQLHKEGFILTQQPTWWWQEWEAAAHTVSSQEGEGGGGNGWCSACFSFHSAQDSVHTPAFLPQLTQSRNSHRRAQRCVS